MFKKYSMFAQFLMGVYPQISLANRLANAVLPVETKILLGYTKTADGLVAKEPNSLFNKVVDLSVADLSNGLLITGGAGCASHKLLGSLLGQHMLNGNGFVAVGFKQDADTLKDLQNIADAQGKHLCVVTSAELPRFKDSVLRALQTKGYVYLALTAEDKDPVVSEVVHILTEAIEQVDPASVSNFVVALSRVPYVSTVCIGKLFKLAQQRGIGFVYNTKCLFKNARLENVDNELYELAYHVLMKATSDDKELLDRWYSCHRVLFEDSRELVPGEFLLINHKKYDGVKYRTPCFTERRGREQDWLTA